MSVVPSSGQIQVGQTGLSANDFIPPRVKILQQMAKEVADKKGDPGDYFNTLTGENLGQTLRVAPLFTFMNRVFIVRKEKRDEANAKLAAAGVETLPSDAEGLQCRSIDMVHGDGTPGIICVECPLSQWEGRSIAPLCSETYNVVALTEQGDIVFISLSKSSAKVGKRINSVLRMTSRKPWTLLWEFTTRQERNDQGIFYVADFAVTKEPTPTELLGEAAHFAQMFEGVAIDVTEDVASDEEGTRKQPF